MTVQDHEYVPGLAGIPAAESAISWIDGQVGILEYRGHRIEVLAERSNFEEVCWLLLHGALPTASELSGFRERIAAHRALSGEVVDAIRAFPPDGHPMAAIQAGLAALGMASPEVDLSDDASCDDAVVRILAATPSIIATFERSRQGLEVLPPDPALGRAANFLWMLTGTKPDEFEAHVLDVALVLHADHTMNASTFTARVVASTEADPYSVCAAACGSLKGPLHGGANERVLQQLEAIGDADAVPGWTESQIAGKRKIMGFGHRVYKTKDPRSKILQDLATRLFERLGTTKIYDTALALEQIMLERLGDKGIHPNVDFFSGIVYSKMGIPTDMFTPIFAISRVAGWLAHWREQMQDNRIFRPRQVFGGSHGAEFLDIADR
ncbi:MAG: citrate synthase [Planctomycetota bacterium]|nr:citrate synthase [Planctomycetota bacterium]MDP6990660.1 citrate synthase [Planctomycetota bacterium]